jgi:aldehyde dehydrogenase (NAD+)
MHDRYAQIYSRQKAFFENGHTRRHDFRVRQLKQLRKAIKTFEPDIIAALQKDLRKAPAEAFATEIGFAYKEIDHILTHLHEWMAPTNVSTPLIAQPSSSRILHDPLGLVLIIAPWNYPFQLLVAPLAGAIAGGNCAILKPSEETPHTALVIGLMIEQYFDDQYIAVVQGAEVVPQLMDRFRFDHVFFTGSVPVGKTIMAAAAKHLTPVTLELGGKSPCIIDKYVSLAKAARRIAWGKFVNAGQTCVAPDYLLVHAEVKDVFLSHLLQAIRKFYGDDPALSPDYPRMVNKKRFDAVKRLMSHGRVLIGGQANEEDLYIAPTVLDEVRLDDPVMQEEIFGPLLPVLTFSDIHDVPSIITHNPYPLALYLFSSSKKTQQYILDNVRFGGGCINDTLMHLGNPDIPFGGVGTSGFGAYHGKFSFDTFTHAKGVLSTTTVVDIPLRYPPYGKWAEKIVRGLMG